MTNVPPVMLSAIVCDRIIFDRISGRPSLINILNEVNSPHFPLRCSLVFFSELTNGHGLTETRIAIIDSCQNDKVIFEQNGKIEFKNVKQIVSLALNMQGVLFPAPGEYRFQLFASGNLCGERRFICRKVNLENKKPDADKSQL